MACRIAILATVLAFSGSGFGQSTQPWVRTVYPPPGAPATQACVVLDPMVFAQATPGLRDLRLVQDGAEIPYALEESFDEHAVSSGADAGADRSLFLTVTTLRLAPDPDTPGGEIAYGWIPAHVPVERILLKGPNGVSPAAAGSVRMELVAAPGPVFPQVGNKDVEVVDETLPISHPAAVTPLGANLQTFAAVLVRVGKPPSGVQYDDVLLQMRRRSLCYQPRNTRSLELFYGGSRPELRRYAFAAQFHPSADAPLARLGPQQSNQQFHPAAASGHWTRSRLLVPLAAVALGLPLLLAGALLRHRIS